MKKIRVAISGYGNIGKNAIEAVIREPDMELAGVIRRTVSPEDLANNKDITFIDEKTDIKVLGAVDVVILCNPSRQVEEYATKYLSQGIHTVDSFDIHDKITTLQKKLREVARQNNAVAMVAAGWDPGSDSIIRALFMAMTPIGITYTNFGPGMSMGHTVALGNIDGVVKALSVTIPIGTGLHRRMLYIELEKDADLEQVTQNIKTDAYFCNDELQIIPVKDIELLKDTGHGVNLTRKGRSANSDNQILNFDMRINNPALTAQIMVSCARACTRMASGAYTMIEIPLIDLLAGDRETIINNLV